MVENLLKFTFMQQLAHAILKRRPVVMHPNIATPSFTIDKYLFFLIPARSCATKLERNNGDHSTFNAGA
jgi:hypothetical protein